jgi:hypothetical protein
MRRGAATLVTVGLLALPATAVAGDGSFTIVGPPPGIGDAPVDVAAGDFNSDGDLDLAVANYFADSVSILVGGPGTTFSPIPGSPIAVDDGPSGLATGDFNADGDEDLAVTNQNSDNLTVLVGSTGADFFTQPGTPVTIGDSPTAIVAGDFNADGDDDLAVTLKGNDDDVIALLGAGGAGFAINPPISVGDEPSDIAAGDFDGDGDEDLVTANFTTNISILSGDGNGGFSVNPIGIPGQAQGVEVADFDGDGHDDLAVTQYNNDQVLLFSGPGPSFTAAGILSTARFPADFALGDFNSDTDPDLALAEVLAGTLSILTGSAEFGFSQGPGSPIATGGANVGAVGDLDGDGNQDLVATNAGSDGLTILSGGGTPLLAGNQLAAGGAEGGGAATSSAAAPPLPSPWQASGPLTFIRYGTFGDYPRIAEAAAWEGGLNFFGGGPANAASSATQTVDVSAQAVAIDRGIATARLAARLGGFRTDNDRMTVTATFLDANGGALGSFAVGPVTAAERANRTVLLPRSATNAVPSATRQIQVRLDATRSGGSSNDAYADNIQLNLIVPDVDPPNTKLTKKPKKKVKTEKKKAKVVFKFKSTEADSTFECKLDKDRFKPCDSPFKAKVKVGKHKFRVAATDAAGNTDPSPAKAKWKVKRTR